MSPSFYEYDVFISFRGEDIRKTFAATLHETLCRANIKTFIDYNLRKTGETATSLGRAIYYSRISIIVFSKNYATSKWCLHELAQIMMCRRECHQVVMPVFYEVDPSDVRKQTGSYEKAFARYITEVAKSPKFEQTVIDWKAALTQAANITGWDSRAFSDDPKLAKEIVKVVSKMLSLMYPNELNDFIETDENSVVIESLLKKHQRIGIWGLGGMGKTTIAKILFAKHFAIYESACLLENVREDTKKNGVTHVRNKLLCELLSQPVSESEAVGLHKFIRKRLADKMILVVLDDVDDTEQLNDLCGYLAELRPDSRLIITTENRQVLDGKVDKTHRMEIWKFPESLRLFSLGAFKQDHPKEGYYNLSKRAVAYAKGIPLALKTLGSHLGSKEPDIWDSELTHLERNNVQSLTRVERVLKLSHDGLTIRERDIFLDIAFFLNDEKKDFVTRILDARGFDAASGIKYLEEKALVTISNNNRIQMHDLLKKLALQIVRYNEYLIRRDPEQRSRLCDTEEVRDVFKSRKETHKIEGIHFDLSQDVKLQVQVDTFNKMEELRFLRFNVPLGKKRLTMVKVPEDLKSFPDKLIYLEWNGYPLKTLPQLFVAELLVEIRLPHSDVEYLWHDKQKLVNLEGIDLSECKKLVTLPDLSDASKLKWLYLSGCESLCEVKPSVFSNDTLVTLILDRCIKLQNLKSEKHLTSLEKIDVYGCSSLKEFSLSSDSIERLDLSETGTEVLHSSIRRMRKLVFLNLEGLRLTNLPDELSFLKSLIELRISDCDLITKSKLETVFDGELRSLKILDLKECSYLLELPTNIYFLSSLYELRLDGSNVEVLPDSIESLSELYILSIKNCRKLRFLPKLPPHIKELHADNCTSLLKVSTLKTFSESMNGENKYISFKNDIELDESSLVSMMEDVILTMKSAALHNMSIEKYSFQTHSYNYDSAVVRLPGSSVPEHFEYRAPDSSTITLEMTKFYYGSRGLIFCVVVSPSNGTRERGHGVQIQCQCFMKDGRKTGVASMWHHKDIEDLNMDHVFVWYDPYNYDSIRHFPSTISFEFNVTTDSGENDDFFSIKECGIYPIYTSEFPALLDKLTVEKGLESSLRCQINNDLEMLESFQRRQVDGESSGKG